MVLVKVNPQVVSAITDPGSLTKRGRLYRLLDMRLIDFHTHAFPDSLAGKAIPFLEEEGGLEACLDGRLSSLEESMDRVGIETSIVASIATRPDQFSSILSWSRDIASDRFIPFPSIHPDHPDVLDQIEKIRREGLKGIKMHPYYQGFLLDEERMFPIYERIAHCGLILLMHTGFDLAFKRDRLADPERILRVLDTIPTLKLVASHLGAWDDWDQVERHLLGREIYMDVSYSMEFMEWLQARRFLLSHPEE
ncbi:MAG TPA: amidohydrolase family protein, partial [Spirochaetia bacterium]|nr:amidohydrolase family protein [Spirochaetia bacterium]